MDQSTVAPIRVCDLPLTEHERQVLAKLVITKRRKIRHEFKFDTECTLIQRQKEYVRLRSKPQFARATFFIVEMKKPLTAAPIKYKYMDTTGDQTLLA